MLRRRKGEKNTGNETMKILVFVILCVSFSSMFFLVLFNAGWFFFLNSSFEVGLDWIGFFVFISIIHLKEKAQRLFKEKAQEKQGFE